MITRIDCDVMANLKRPLLGLGHWIRVIQDAGGVWTVIKRLSRLVQNEVLGAPYWDQVCYCVCVCAHRDGPAEIRTGTLVGADKFGNKYYENNNYIWCKTFENV